MDALRALDTRAILLMRDELSRAHPCRTVIADPIAQGGEVPFQTRVPGARNVAHTTLKGSHFIQGDSPGEIAALLDGLVASLSPPEPAA